MNRSFFGVIYMDEDQNNSNLPAVRSSGQGSPMPTNKPAPIIGPKAQQQHYNIQPLNHVPPQQADDDSQIAVSLPDDAADADLIEKEWVMKAKQIVDHTTDDPYAQAKEIAKVKAAYMKKRYNKDIVS